MADPTSSTFLKSFGQFHVATLQTKEVSAEQILLEEMREFRAGLLSMKRLLDPNPYDFTVIPTSGVTISGGQFGLEAKGGIGVRKKIDDARMKDIARHLAETLKADVEGEKGKEIEKGTTHPKDEQPSSES